MNQQNFSQEHLKIQNELRSYIIHTINEYYNSGKNSKIEEIIIKKIHNKNSTTYKNWLSFIQILKDSLGLTVYDLTSGQEPSLSCSISLEKIECEKLTQERILVLNKSVLNDYYSITERTIVKTYINKRGYSSLLTIGTSPSGEFEKIFLKTMKLFSIKNKKFQFVPASIWKEPILNRTVHELIFSRIAVPKYYFGNDNYYLDLTSDNIP